MNKFKRILNVLMKYEDARVCRQDDMYYLTQGNFILKMDDINYISYAVPMNVCFPKLQNGEGIIIRKKGQLPEVDPDPLKQWALYALMVREATKLVEETPFLQQLRNINARLLSCGKTIIYMNEEFVSAASKFVVGPYKGEELWSAPIVWDEFYAGVAILPINRNENGEIDKLRAFARKVVDE